MFRKSYVRGVNKALITAKAVKYANEEMATGAADAVAETLPEQPVDDVAPDATAEIATTLVDLSNKLEEASTVAAGVAEVIVGGGEGAAPEAPMPAPEPAAPPAPPTPPAPEATEADKEASLKSAAVIMRTKLDSLRDKVATNPTGSTITGEKPHQANTEPLSENAEAKMDLANRPESYANVGEDGVGKQEASGEGAVGDENVVPGTGMGPVGEDGSNSATEAIKSANLRALIKKTAMGTTITGDKPHQQNTQAQAAQVSGEGAMEAKNRPEDYAVKGEDAVGHSDMADQIRASAVGTEAAHPGTMGPVGVPGTNTAIQQTPGEGATGKTAEENEWLARFKTTSAKYAQSLPFWMDQNEKVAAVQYFMSLSPSEAQSIASSMQKTAEVPEGLKEYVAKKKGKGEEKKEDKKEDKKDEEDGKKEASLRAGDIVEKLRSLQA